MNRNSCDTCGLAIIGAAALAFLVALAGRVEASVATAGGYTLTDQDIQKVLAVDGLAIETPLSPAELQEARDNIVDEFKRDPAAFEKSKPLDEKLAEIALHGSQSDRTQVGILLYSSWMHASPSDPLVARWVAIVKRHNPPIVEGDGFVVTGRQMDAIFASNDWVARTAGQPVSTPESRAAYIRMIKSAFPSLPRVAKEALANADQRWLALQDPILDHSDLHATAVSEVHQHVHGPKDVAKEARTLENAGLKFHAETQQFAENMALIGGLAVKGQSTAEGINFATRKFMGEGP